MIAAAKPLTLTRPAMARPSLAITKARKCSLVVRSAESEPKPMADAQTNEDGTVFYAGNTFASEEEVSTLIFSSCIAMALAPKHFSSHWLDRLLHTLFLHLCLLVSSI